MDNDAVGMGRGVEKGWRGLATRRRRCGSGDFGRSRDFDERDRERGHLGEYVQQVVDADQVTVLVVAHHPLGRVVDLGFLWKYQRLGEVDQPYVGVLAVVHEQQRTTDHLRGHTTEYNIIIVQYRDKYDIIFVE